MAGLNYFSRVLRERSGRYAPLQRSNLGCGLLVTSVFALGLMGTVMERPGLVFGTLFLALVFFGFGYLQGRGESVVRQVRAERGEIGELLDELLWMETTKQLGERTHPELRLLLERATLARNEIMVAMKSEEWVRKGKKEPWKQIREGCLRTADEGWEDVVWLGRNLFRRKGWRTDTFERNCADPEFGRKALASVEAVVVTLEGLAANVKGESETDQSVIRRTRRRLEELMAAEAELGEEPEFLREEL